MHAYLSTQLSLLHDYLSHVHISILPASSKLHHFLGAGSLYLSYHHGLRCRRHYDRTWPAEEVGRCDSGYACIAAGGGVEVYSLGCLRALERAKHVVGYAAGFEGATRLESLEFQEDSASTV